MRLPHILRIRRAHVHGYHPRENERLQDRADFPMETQYTYRPTPEESAAIDEAIRSLEAGKGIPASEMRQRFAAKWSR